MKAYMKPKLDIIEYTTNENFADLWSDIFGTGEDIPVSIYTMNDDSSAA